MFDFVKRIEDCDFRQALEIVSEFGVARESEPRSGERFRAREGGEAPSARGAGGQDSPYSRARILALLDATERVLAAIRRTNDEHSRLLATACEPVREQSLLEPKG